MYAERTFTMQKIETYVICIEEALRIKNSRVKKVEKQMASSSYTR